MQENCESVMEKYLCAIIRKPQEGKTFICLENINMSPESYHLIITMNTIKSNLQFFERARDRFGRNICVFNSKVVKKDQSPDYLHAKDVTGVKKHLKNGANVVIMCAHHKRFDACILDLLEEIDDSQKIRKSVVIHIDEAHAYVPPYKDRVAEMNQMSITEKIYMYSATPFSIWADESSPLITDSIFKHIYIVDIEEQFSIVKSDKYFGVKDCYHSICSSDQPSISPLIPADFIERWGNEKQRGKMLYWYQEGAPFDIGNELKMISHVRNTLLSLNGTGITNDKYSYNFVPGYSRKLTHYYIMETILEIFKDALVIIINGDGSYLIRGDSTGLPISENLPSCNEPSKQIEHCSKRFPNRPVFITGFHCVGMSVTFINPSIGNFDNVIYSHEHYMKRPDIQYQLCRFLFNYITWSEEEIKKIKKTRLYVSSQDLLQNCLDYETRIDAIEKEMSGSLRTRGEVVGEMKIKGKKIPKERMFDSLEPYVSHIDIKQVSVDPGEDDIALEKVQKIYKDFIGKDLSGKSMPNKEYDFYICSTTKKAEKQINPAKLKKTMKSWKKTSNFAIRRGAFRYARVYVAYDDEDDPSEYRWFIRMMELEDSPDVDAIWDSIEEKKN
jgi:hypothetical protein